MDRIWRNLSYSLHLLIGLGCFISLPIDHSGWLAAKGGMWALAVLELDPLSDTCFRFRPGLPGMQVDTLVNAGLNFPGSAGANFPTSRVRR
ncbi:hypothetical protein, partial [Phaeobacter sp. SYSU ZJ3003]|uniref:hypothetical protein n=1 Tax=Phaeobacter sp. SYSU ZJ3003 TaxID=2109330 RepID=UPI00351C6536